MGFLDFYFVVDFSLILYDDFDELLRLDRVGFVFDQNDYLGKFEKQYFFLYICFSVLLYNVLLLFKIEF